MSGVKFELQKELFEGTKERLHAVVGVTKTSQKKKKVSYLCLTGSIERPIRFTIYLVKGTEKGFKRKHEWTLSSLKEVNYKAQSSTDFDLQLEKSYHWTAASIEDKDNFVSLLHQIASRMHRPPKFLNYQAVEDNDSSGGTEGMSIVPVPKDEQIVESDEEEFGLTEREEFDLEKVLSRTENAVVNAEAFMLILAKELSILDGENIHSIMDSETQVNLLMERIDESIVQLEKVESELTDYEDSVVVVKAAVEKIEEENSQMGTAAKNQQLLLQELTVLIQALDFPTGSNILSSDLSSREGIEKATKDAYCLKDALAMEEKIHPALLKMHSVGYQKARLEKIKDKFAKGLTSHLAKLFIHHGNISSVDTVSFVTHFRLAPLTTIHQELNAYTELMLWLKSVEPDCYSSLLQKYTSSTQKVYDRNVKALFEEARVRISGNTASASRISSSTSDLRVRGKFFGKTRSLASRDGDTESQGSGEGSVDSSERQHFYDVLEQLLEGLEPTVNSEEKFITRFFHVDVISSSSPSVVISPSKTSGSVELRRIMGILFGSIESELNSFLVTYEKMESSFCMGAMVRLGSHALKPENTSTFIGMIYGSVLVQEKRSFDRLMNSYVQAINESRLPRKTKPGILPFISEFEDFAMMAESIFGNSARRSDLEKWYVRMLTAIFDAIMRLAGDGGKTPGEVIRMENFHRLHANLSQLKVVALDNQKKDAKTKYNEALNAYVTKYFGRPLVKLNEFFEGVQARVSQGVKESEIGYQMAFSRAELKRVIKEYPAKEVKKGLEALYKKVEKHLSEAESLLQVVWRAMQEEFIVQYKSIESLVSRCYPGAKITLDFTIDDILLFFSEIAQSH